ncbi:MAG: ABC transporter ATP-binding protein/permease, partial [Candidatus Aminicenantes bacterium]|nr:ABC transporter ATP-binding protein/permease [Candidatus Aminicenantes bacterium]
MFLQFLKSFLRFARWRAALATVLMIFLGITQGIGILLIIPLLGLLGVGQSAEQTPSGIAIQFRRLFHTLGIPPNLTTILLLYIGLVSLIAFIKRYNSILESRLVQEFVKDMRDRLYQILSHLDWLSFIREKSSDAIHIVTMDLERTAYGAQMSVRMLGQIILAVFYIAAAFIVSPPMTLFALACGLILLLLLLPLNRRAHKLGESLRSAREGLFSTIKDNLDGMKIAKSYELEGAFNDRFQRITTRSAREIVGYMRINSTTRMIYEIGAVAALCGFFLVAVKVFELPVVNLLLIVFIFSRILPAFSFIQQSFQQVANSVPSFTAAQRKQAEWKAVQEDLPRESPAPLGLEKEIELRGISFRYSKGGREADEEEARWALRDINLVLPARSMTAVVGASGAGKSTLADILMGLLVPDLGEMRIDGTLVQGETVFRWRKTIGYVPQETFLFNDTVRANLLVAWPEARDDD